MLRKRHCASDHNRDIESGPFLPVICKNRAGAMLAISKADVLLLVHHTSDHFCWSLRRNWCRNSLFSATKPSAKRQSCSLSSSMSCADREQELATLRPQSPPRSWLAWRGRRSGGRRRRIGPRALLACCLRSRLRSHTGRPWWECICFLIFQGQ